MILGTKHLLKSTLLVVGLVVLFGQSSIVLAQVPFPGGDPDLLPQPATSNVGPAGGGFIPANSYNVTGGANAGNLYANPSGNPSQATLDTKDADLSAPPADIPALTLGSPIYDMLFAFVITVFGTLFSWSGIIFDIGLNQFVLGFGYQYYDRNVGFAIEAVWTIVRDLFNLTFIFGLVYIGFKMILNSDDSSARKMLISLLGAALLVNFSLFIVKFVIDVANVAAVVIARGFGDDPNLSITNGFLNLIQFGTILKLDPDQIQALQNGGAFAYIFGLLIFFAVGIFVFAAGGILMIVRFVVLCAYMVFSPVMFIGWVFPSMASHSKKYMRGFLGNAFFAPAYIMMLYLSYKVLSEYATQLGPVNYGALFAAGPGAAGTAAAVIPFFILTMTFLVLSLVVAKNMGAVGASTAISIGNKWRGSAQSYLGAAVGGATFGMAARAGRGTVGAGAHKLTQADWFRDGTAKFGRAGRSLYNSTAKVGDSSFDGRKVAGLGKAMGIGEGKKGGATTRIKEQKEADEKFLKDIGTRDADKYDAATKEAKKLLEEEEDKFDQEKDTDKRAVLAVSVAKLKKSYEDTKSRYSAREEFSRQLSYAKAVESWEKTQLALTAAAGGVAAGVLTGGILPAMAAGAAAGGALGLGNRTNNRQTTGAIRKDYGKNGLKKRKHNHEEHAIKKAMAAVGGEHKAEKPQVKTPEKKATIAPDTKHVADEHHEKPADSHDSAGGGDHPPAH